MLSASLFGNFNVGTVIMIVLAAVIGIYLYWLDKKEKSDPLAALCKQYATLSADTLAALPGEEPVRAVAANILAKTDRRRPDVYTLIPTLSHGRTAVYSVWLVCRELESASLADLLQSPSGAFCEFAVDGFAYIGADACCEQLRAALEAVDTASHEAALREAIAAEQPLTLCADCIRATPADFTDS